MKFLYLIIIICLPLFIVAQINNNGIPNIRNYSNEVYAAAEQNWCIVRDNRGVVYFGNNADGVLEYDGINWRKIKLPNSSIVRSLTIDDKGTVFVGAVSEFGYLTPDQTGNLQYKSLSQNLDTSISKFTNVWKTYFSNKEIKFCTPTGIYTYNYKTVDFVQYSEKYGFLSFLINDKIYVGDYAKGLMTLENNELRVVKGGDFFALKNIMSIIPVEGNKFYIGTSNNGIFILDTETGSVLQDRINDITNNIFSSSILYHGIKSRGANQIYSTLYDNGILTIDEKGKIIKQINVNNGLSDNQVFNVYLSNDDQLWAALNNGISKIDINSPIAHFGELSGIKGGVNDIIRFKDILYIATGNGVYYLSYENEYPQIKQISDINTTWKLSDFIKQNGDTILIAGTSDGLFEIYSLDQAKSIEKSITNLSHPAKRFLVYSLFPSKVNKGKLYVGGNKELVSLINNEDSWKIEFEVSEINDEVRSIIEQDDGLIWLCSGFSGIFSIMNNGSKSQVKKYTISDGLPSLASNYAFYIDSTIVFASSITGLFSFNNKKNKFEPYLKLGECFSNGTIGAFRIAQDKTGDVWIHLSKEIEKQKGDIQSYKWIERVFKVGNEYIRDSIPFKVLPSLTYEAIYNDSNDITWFGNSKGIYSYDAKVNKKYDLPYNTLIRKVIVGVDSIAFLGTYFEKVNDSIYIPSVTQPKDLKLSLNYKNNNITFEFAAPFFDDESATVYSSILEGYKEDSWSKWSNKNERIYTNLNEGDYSFKVKAKNIYGIESEVAIFEFTILPPWYRTVWAYILYLIIAVVVVYIIIKVYTRRLEMEKIRLEGIVKERTAEVVRQKDDIEKKNSILEVQKVEIERQKDVVTEQKDHIQHILTELKDSILYAERIQKAILPHGEYVEQILNDFFILFKPKDVVSGDFYFATKVNNYVIFASADCTGHGVPGAFMSMMGVAFLNEIVNNETVQEAGQALDMLRENIIKSLQQTGKPGEQKDGMDISFCVLDERTNILQWAGANNPMYIVKKQKTDSRLIVKKAEDTEIIEPALSEFDCDLFEIKPDKMPVAIYVKMDNFTNNIIQLEKGDSVYVFTDGFADQFGGERGKKFMYKPFKRLILSIQDKTMKEQRDVLDSAIEEWKSYIDPITNDCFEQIDDICIVSIKVS